MNKERDPSKDLLYDTAEDDEFVEIPMRFGWLDPEEQKKRVRYLEEIADKEQNHE